tara:strand:- start:197906 stop:199069 length:1164 start_codon:yes stop_codon:yes gene_type:complete
MFAPWPYFEEDEMTAVTDVLRSGKVNYWTGKEGKLFEQEFSNYHNIKHGIVIANGTLTLELALYALNICAGDDVIVPSHTFLATASAVVARGAKPVIADIHPDSNCVTAETILAALTPQTKAVIVVHLAGWPCEMDEIIALCQQHNLKLIEDCAQAHGAEYKGHKVGSLGDIASFSFCQDKIMTTGGEGGMVLTNDDALWEKMWSYKDHGKDYDTVFNTEHPAGFRWLHKKFGTNWRLTEMQSAIGRKQLQKLPQWLKLRQRNANILTDAFSNIKALRVPHVPKHMKHANYKYYTYVRPEMLKADWSRDRIMQAITEKGIPCFSGGCSEIYLEDAFKTAGYAPVKRLPNAKANGENSLMFLVHPTLSKQNMLDVVIAVEDVLCEASL